MFDSIAMASSQTNTCKSCDLIKRAICSKQQGGQKPLIANSLLLGTVVSKLITPCSGNMIPRVDYTEEEIGTW